MSDTLENLTEIVAATTIALDAEVIKDKQALMFNPRDRAIAIMTDCIMRLTQKMQTAERLSTSLRLQYQQMGEQLKIATLAYAKAEDTLRLLKQKLSEQ